MIEIPTIEELRQVGLNTWQDFDTSVSVSAYSDAWIRCQVSAVATWGVMAKVDQVQKNIFPNKANRRAFLLHCELHGIEREPANGSQREDCLTVTGTPATSISAGLELVHADRSLYVTTTGGTFDGAGELVVSVESTTLGVITNKLAGELLTVVSPPPNMSQSATLILSLRDGKDVETDGEMLARLLIKLRLVRGGGTRADYELWALEVDGVAEAYCWPTRRGDGTVDVTVLTDAEDRMASSGLLIEVRDYINERRPVTVPDFTVEEPTVDEQAVTAEITVSDGYVASEVIEAAEAAVTAFFRTIPPGDYVLRRNRIISTLMEVDGVDDVTLTAPAANVTSTLTSESVPLITLGTLTITEAT